MLQPKDAALLAVIALSGPLKAEHLAAMLWPTVNARQADTSLRQRLYRLRRDAGLQLLGGGIGLQLQETVQTDLAQALRGSSATSTPRSRSCSATSTSTSCPSWPSGCARSAGAGRSNAPRRWRPRPRAARTRARSRAAWSTRSAWSSSDPLAEHGQRRLMRLHYLRGDRAAAIAAFERFEQRLKDELGTRPSAETIELLATIERGGAALPVRRATAPAGLLGRRA